MTPKYRQVMPKLYPWIDIRWKRNGVNWSLLFCPSNLFLLGLHWHSMARGRTLQVDWEGFYSWPDWWKGLRQMGSRRD